jgi:hypothetical protein
MAGIGSDKAQKPNAGSIRKEIAVVVGAPERKA